MYGVVNGTGGFKALSLDELLAINSALRTAIADNRKILAGLNGMKPEDLGGAHKTLVEITVAQMVRQERLLKDLSGAQSVVIFRTEEQS